MPQTANDTKFISITDFRPGIIESSVAETPITPSVGTYFYNYPVSNFGQGVSQPGPLGSADMNGTWGCVATPSGGLMALPGFLPIGLPLPAELTNGVAGSTVAVAGMKSVGPIYGAGGNVEPQSVYLALNYLNGTTPEFSLCSYGPPIAQQPISTTRAGDSSHWNLNIKTISGGAGGWSGITSTWGVSMDTTRLASGGVYYPVLVFEVSDFLAPSTSLFCGFTPALAGAFASSTAFTSGGSGPLFCHQNRVVQLRWNSIGAYNYSVNENIYYTDPALTSITFTATPSIFVAEAPTNINCWGSISTGELLCIKAWGGGFIMTGDFNNPTVTRLPGIRSTGNVSMKGVQTPTGLVYMTENDGVWLWNGSNSSSKISHNLVNSRFHRYFPVIGGQTYHLDSWGEWVFFPQGILWDFNTNGWWQYFNPMTVQPIDLWSRSAGSDRFFWGCVGGYDSTQTLPSIQPPFLFQFGKASSLLNWQWQSNLLPAAVDRTLSITEYELGISIPPVGGQDYTINISSLAYDGSNAGFDSFILSSNTTTPNSPFTNTGYLGYQKVRRQLQGDGYGAKVQVEVAHRANANLLSTNQSLTVSTQSGDLWIATGGTISYTTTALVGLNGISVNNGQALSLVATGGGPMSMSTIQASGFPHIPYNSLDYLGFVIYAFQSSNTSRNITITLTAKKLDGTTTTFTSTIVASVQSTWVRVPFNHTGAELAQLAPGCFIDVTVNVAGTLGANETFNFTAPFLVSGAAFWGWSAINSGNVPTSPCVPTTEWYIGGNIYGGGITADQLVASKGTFSISPIINEFHIGYHEAVKVSS